MISGSGEPRRSRISSSPTAWTRRASRPGRWGPKARSRRRRTGVRIEGSRSSSSPDRGTPGGGPSLPSGALMSTRSPHRSVDVAVLGAGTAGLAAYHAASATGARVLLIEHGPPGTMCARVGCMPSKLLIAAADVAHGAKNAGPFGIRCAYEVDGRAVMERVRHERDRFVDSVVTRMDRIPAEQRMAGRARFVSPQL